MINMSKFKGLDKFVKQLKKSDKIVEAEIKKATKKNLTIMQAETKRQIIAYGAIKDGFMINNTIFEQRSAWHGIVTPNTSYAIYVHEGTWKMQARPFMRSAFVKVRPRIAKEYNEAMERVLMRIKK